MSTDTSHPLFHSYDPYASEPGPGHMQQQHLGADAWPQATTGAPAYTLDRSDSSGQLPRWNDSHQPYSHHANDSYGGSDDRLRQKESAGAASGAGVHRTPTRVQQRSTWHQVLSTYNTFNQIAFMTIILVQTLSVLALIAVIYQTVKSVSWTAPHRSPAGQAARSTNSASAQAADTEVLCAGRGRRLVQRCDRK